MIFVFQFWIISVHVSVLTSTWFCTILIAHFKYKYIYIYIYMYFTYVCTWSMCVHYFCVFLLDFEPHCTSVLRQLLNVGRWWDKWGYVSGTFSQCSRQRRTTLSLSSGRLLRNWTPGRPRWEWNFCSVHKETFQSLKLCTSDTCTCS